ncbi:hypothetical protein D9M72_405240 [compost metagenome]
MTDEKFKALKEDDVAIGGRMSFWGNKQPKCPHCGKEIDIGSNDWWRLYEEGCHEVECPECEEPFSVVTRVSYSFSTDSQEGV